MKFKEIEVGMEVITVKGITKDQKPTRILEVNHQRRTIVISSLFGRMTLYEFDRNKLWDIYQPPKPKEPEEPEHLKVEDYEMLLDMALAMRDKAWFDELYEKMNGLKRAVK